MSQRWLLAVTASAMFAGTAAPSAQDPAAPSPRPFSGLFGASAQPPKPVVPLGPRTKLTAPSPAVRPVDCHMIVIPADPRIDPRISIAPPDSRRFAVRATTSPVCR
jgi:hypothetical protein